MAKETITGLIVGATDKTIELDVQAGSHWRYGQRYAGVKPGLQDYGKLVTIEVVSWQGNDGDTLWFVQQVEGEGLIGQQQAAAPAQPTAAPQPASAPTAAPAAAPAPSVTPLAQAAAKAEAPRMKSRSPADHFPGDFAYKDLAIAAENALNNAANITGALIAAGLQPDVDVEKLVKDLAGGFLDWHADRLAMRTWGSGAVTREPVADGPPSGMPPDDAPPHTGQT